MNLKKTAVAVAVGCTLGFAVSAQAAVVGFGGGPSTTFADGTFSTNLSGFHPDGFYAIGATSAYNGFGQDGEYVSFNSAVTLNSLVLSDALCCYRTAASVTALLFDSSNNLLTSQTWFGGSSTLTFNTANVSKLRFDITSVDTFNIYGGSDTRTNVSWYEVSDITYNVNAVPEPETYAMLLAGLGLMGFAARRRKQKLAAA